MDHERKVEVGRQGLSGIYRSARRGLAHLGLAERRQRRAWARYRDARDAYRTQRVEQLQAEDRTAQPADRDVAAYTESLEREIDGLGDWWPFPPSVLAPAVTLDVATGVWSYQDIVDREA